MLNDLLNEIKRNSSEEKAEIMKRFFKVGKGDYSEGDIFIGLTMPQQRDIARKYIGLSLSKIKDLLKSKIHEHRMIGLIILTEKYKKSPEHEKENIFGFYIKNMGRINNWDLVDVSAPHIVGDFLFNKNKKILYDLVISENLWERRISIVSTFNFIRKGELEDALAISEMLLGDKHDLIHKAVGWMLREVGKRDSESLKKFIRDNYGKIPRTTLRYSIEKFPEEERKSFLNGIWV